MEPTRLLIIDDHDDVREALTARLDANPGIEVVACTGCWRDGLDAALELVPDVVLLETKRADGQGLEALACLSDQCPGTRVIVLTSYVDRAEHATARSKGAARYLLKDIDTAHLVRAIQSLAGR
jgi:DNA-binding NarL/FixJ family response regulator